LTKALKAYAQNNKSMIKSQAKIRLGLIKIWRRYWE
jgi:hypothetical protein